MTKIYKKRSNALKGKVALEAIKGNKTTAQLCQEYSVASCQIFAWKKQLEENCEALFEDTQKSNHKDEIDRLHKVIGQLTAERDFLEHVLKR
jgi:transposase